MTNANSNARFFSFDKILLKESPGSLSVFLSLEDIPDITSICSYGLFFDAILKMEGKAIKIENSSF